MNDRDALISVMESGEQRRAERRRFLTAAGMSVGGLAMLSACSDNDDIDIGTPAPTPTPTPTPGATTDADVLNFALNLEYLEAQFYAFAALGSGLPVSALGGTGTQGTVTGGRRVTFTDPIVAQYAREIAADESAHVNFLRAQLGNSAVAMPSINIDGGATGAFTAAARAAGLVPATGTFDPYANDENFLLAAFIFEDVGVTAYKGAVSLITNKTFVEAAAGIHAAEAYHAGLIRTVLYRKGLTTPSLIDATESISNARDSLDGSSDLDQGIRPSGSGATLSSNIVPTDSSGIAYSRTAGQVLNITYLNRAATTSGGFFPSGVNGNIRTSAAN